MTNITINTGFSFSNLWKLLSAVGVLVASLMPWWHPAYTGDPGTLLYFLFTEFQDIGDYFQAGLFPILWLMTMVFLLMGGVSMWVYALRSLYEIVVPALGPSRWQLIFLSLSLACLGFILFAEVVGSYSLNHAWGFWLAWGSLGTSLAGEFTRRGPRWKTLIQKRG